MPGLLLTNSRPPIKHCVTRRGLGAPPHPPPPQPVLFLHKWTRCAHVTLLSPLLHTCEVKRATFISANERQRQCPEHPGDGAKIKRLGRGQPLICPKLTRACGKTGLDCLVFWYLLRTLWNGAVRAELQLPCVFGEVCAAQRRETQGVQSPPTIMAVWSERVGIVPYRLFCFQVEQQCDAELDSLQRLIERN